MANMHGSINGVDVSYGSLYEDIANEVFGKDKAALIGRLKMTAPNATTVAEYEEIAGLGEADIGESKVRASLRF
jgi:hypothetical protein